MTVIFLDADGLFRFQLFLFKSLFRSESLSRTTVLPYITSIHLPTPSLPFAITHKVRSASQYLPGHRTHASHTSQGVMHFMQSSSHAVHKRQVSNEKCRPEIVDNFYIHVNSLSSNPLLPSPPSCPKPPQQPP